MLPFMQVSRIGATRIRFMPNSLGYYSYGHPLVTITSGVLAGLQGYVVRIAREKRLVTSIGNMTIAISGIHKESFENAEEYVRARREQERRSASFSSNIILTPEQTEIDRCFFTPKSRIDVLTIAGSLDKWIMRANYLIGKGECDKAVDIALFILEEIGSRAFHGYEKLQNGRISDIVSDLCRDMDYILSSAAGRAGISEELKERVATEKQSLLIRYPFLELSDDAFSSTINKSPC